MSCDEMDGMVDWLGQSEADRWREPEKETERLFRQGHYVEVRFGEGDQDFELTLFRNSDTARKFHENSFARWESIPKGERDKCNFDLVLLYDSGCMVAGKICPSSKRTEVSHE